jgi:hypothetical protein
MCTPVWVDSAMHAPLDGGIKFYIKIIMFYFVRLLCCSFLFAYKNSRFRRFDSLVLWIITYHRGTAPQLRYTSASLPSPSYLFFLSSFGAPVSKEDEQNDSLLPLSLHSITDYMGHNTTAVSPFYAWAETAEYEKEASRLVDRCERLYQSFVAAGGKDSENGVIE